jgi:tetratricopeptide (TPR) repeat protein
VAVTAVLGLLLALSIRQVGSLDIGFHLKAGQWILSGHGWPRNDPFTFTLADHAYVDTSWGFQVLAALAHRLAGPAGLVAFQVVTVLSTFGILWRTCRLAPVDPAVLIVLLLLGTLASELRFEPRPELVSFVLLATTLHVLHRHALGLASPLWLLPVLFLVWANIHALWVLGFVGLGAFCLGLLIHHRRLDRRLLAWGAASLAATLVNPYGIRGVLFPIQLLSRFRQGNIFADTIGEFVSPLSLHLPAELPFYPVSAIGAFRALAILALPAAAVALAKRRAWCVLVLVAYLLLAVAMIRNVPLFVVGGLPVIAWGLPVSTWPLRWRVACACRCLLERAVVVAVAIVAAVLLLRVVHDAHYVSARRPDRFGWGWNTADLPVEATRFALDAGLRGRMLNELGLGGYLMWALPEPVFIDGRLEVVGEQFFTYYLEALNSEKGLEACVQRYGIQWVVFRYASNPRLLSHLSGDARWQLAYFDSVAAIFVRASPEARRYVEPTLPATFTPRRPIDLASLPGFGDYARDIGFGHFLAGLWRREILPKEPRNRGIFHYVRGELDLAQVQFARAIRESRGAYDELYIDLGTTLLRQGKVGDARRCYLIVLENDPDNELARARLAELAKERAGRPR